MLGHYSVSSPIPTMYLFDAETALHSFFLKLFFCLILSFCQGRDKQWNILKVSALIDFAGRHCMYIKNLAVVPQHDLSELLGPHENQAL